MKKIKIIYKNMTILAKSNSNIYDNYIHHYFSADDSIFGPEKVIDIVVDV